MNGTPDIGAFNLAAAYLLAIPPLMIVLWLGAPLAGRIIAGLARMTLQLVLVGLYLEALFRWNNPWLTLLWIGVMIGVAESSILRGCSLKMRRFTLPLAAALAAGTLLPLGAFLLIILRTQPVLDARYAVPIGGMILGNCLRANIVGINHFFDALRRNEKTHLLALARGAGLAESLRPCFRGAIQAALTPTIAMMSTIGIVSLPGMMTGVMLGGADPLVAIKYQLAIMLAIFSGTAVTVFLGIYLSIRPGFDAYGLLRRDNFRNELK